MCRSSRLIRLGSLAAAALLTGCSEPGANDGTITVVHGSTTPVAIRDSAPLGRTPTVGQIPATADVAEIIKHDKIERVSAPPRPDLKSPQKLTAQPVDFTPPPLPPELLDDGGLTPLPTRR